MPHSTKEPSSGRAAFGRAGSVMIRAFSRMLRNALLLLVDVRCMPFQGPFKVSGVPKNFGNDTERTGGEDGVTFKVLSVVF